MSAIKAIGLPDVRRHVPLVTALGLSALGSGVAGPMLLLFFIRVAHVSLPRAGAALTGAGLVALAVPALVGLIVDRCGVRAIVIAAEVVQAAAFGGFLLARSWWPLLACAGLAAIGQRAFWSSLFGLVAGVAGGRDSDRWFALAGMVQAAGFAGGALFAGVLLTMHGSAPYLLALGLNAVSFLISALLLLAEPAGRAGPRRAARHDDAPVLRNLPFLSLIALNAAFALCSVLLATGLPVYVTQALAAPAWVVGPLLAIATVVGATCQGFAVRAVRRWRRTRALSGAGLVWSAWGALTAATLVVPDFLVVPVLFLSVLVYAVAELVHAPTSNALAAAAAPTESRARYLSYFQYSFTIAVIGAPSAFAWLYSGGHALPWLAVSALAALAAAGTLLLERRLPAGHPSRSASAAT